MEYKNYIKQLSIGNLFEQTKIRIERKYVQSVEWLCEWFLLLSKKGVKILTENTWSNFDKCFYRNYIRVLIKLVTTPKFSIRIEYSSRIQIQAHLWKIQPEIVCNPKYLIGLKFGGFVIFLKTGVR